MSIERDDKLLATFTVQVAIAEGRELMHGEHGTREIIEDLHIGAAIRNKVNTMLDSRLGLDWDNGVYAVVDEDVEGPAMPSHEEQIETVVEALDIRTATHHGSSPSTIWAVCRVSVSGDSVDACDSGPTTLRAYTGELAGNLRGTSTTPIYIVAVARQRV